eukprot:scaffold285_cov330-Pavlova_lutheri.AAC.129
MVHEDRPVYPPKTPLRTGNTSIFVSPVPRSLTREFRGGSKMARFSFPSVRRTPGDCYRGGEEVVAPAVHDVRVWVMGGKAQGPPVRWG